MEKEQIILDSSYGGISTVGGGWIENGRKGVVITFSTVEKCDILFEGELSSIKVPCHWFNVEDFLTTIEGD